MKKEQENKGITLIVGIFFLVLVMIAIIIQTMRSDEKEAQPKPVEYHEVGSPQTQAPMQSDSYQHQEYPDDPEYDPNDPDADEIALEYPELAEDYYD